MLLKWATRGVMFSILLLQPLNMASNVVCANRTWKHVRMRRFAKSPAHQLSAQYGVKKCDSARTAHQTSSLDITQLHSSRPARVISSRAGPREPLKAIACIKHETQFLRDRRSPAAAAGRMHECSTWTCSCLLPRRDERQNCSFRY